MWFKTILLSFLIATTSAVTVNLPTDISTYLQDQGYFKDPVNNINNITNAFNDALKSLNLTDIEVNIILNHIEDSQLDTEEFEKSLKYLFNTTLRTNWQMKYILQQIAIAANNLTVNEVLYEILWQELSRDPNKRNPFLYIELYRDLEGVLKNFTSIKLITLQNEIRTNVVESSALIIQSFFINNSTIKQLLKELKPLNNLYQTTIPRIFENLNGIENQWLITKELLDFDNHTQEAVYNHLSYIQYLTAHSEVVPYGIYKNLEKLIARIDFINISISQRQISSKLLPLSMGNLFASQKLCLRNATTNYYLYECPQTYLMCTNFIGDNLNPINRKKAAFEIERIGNDQYTLRSPYWGRYFHLQNSTLKNITSSFNVNNTSSSVAFSKITKNLYSHVDASSWFIRFQGNHATIVDSSETFYVCGGDSSHWNNMEKYSYTRPSKDFRGKENECLWLFEDCSDVV
ncbi:uncharacterized protein LOC111679195 [Lucilia cuprina]|uniref:uncharacterized protein LOC111679195 n=1 Tax=Lucilia cuprina TaxID=7375 RepID=UPI001F0666D3|nr:uncharacterized protein LOC111679195 [Lucilia cuprina]